MNVIIITQARVGSTRLPNKVLLKINNDSLLGIHLRRLKKSKKASMVLLATTFEKGVNKILEVLLSKNFSREDCVISIGGGITGDISGFSASLFKRGL